MQPGQRLVLYELLVFEDRPNDPRAVLFDLHMLVMHRARERTEAELRQLLAQAGFTVERVAPAAPSPLHVLVATAR